MQSPNNGTTLNGSTVTFRWSDGEPVDLVYWYSIYIGRSVGQLDIDYLQTDPCPCSNELTSTEIPTDGSTVYVRLYTQFLPGSGGGLKHRDYVYTASGTSAMLEPLP